MVRMGVSRRMTLKATRVKVLMSHPVSHICQAYDTGPSWPGMDPSWSEYSDTPSPLYEKKGRSGG